MASVRKMDYRCHYITDKIIKNLDQIDYLPNDSVFIFRSSNFIDKMLPLFKNKLLKNKYN